MKDFSHKTPGFLSLSPVIAGRDVVDVMATDGRRSAITTSCFMLGRWVDEFIP